MSNNVVLSAGVRQNLLSLQSTADMMALTQNRLATGKKVNSALDNPSNFFTSQSLSNRANDLNALLDSVGQSQQTLKAADAGITSLTKLVQSAKSIVTQAQQATRGTVSYTNVTGTAAIAADTTRVTSTSTVAAAGFAVGDTLTLSDGTNTATFSYVASGASAAAGTFTTAAELVAAINDAASSVRSSMTASAVGGALQLDAAGTVSITAGGTNGAAKLGLPTTPVSSNYNSTLASLTGSLSVQVGSGSASTIAFGSGSGEVNTRGELETALAALTNVTASVNGASRVNIAPTSSENVTIGGSASVLTGLGLTANTLTPSATVVSANATRASLQSDFNSLLSQLDQLAQDASYNGINLLNGDDLKVPFNEDASSSLTIAGVKFSASGLGLTAVAGSGFQDNKVVGDTLAKIDGALDKLRTQASKFGSNLTTVQTRQDFTKNLIATLQTGSDNLVLADTNEEGANLLALQTRQQLSTTALSMAAQADQAVLRLFG